MGGFSFFFLRKFSPLFWEKTIVGKYNKRKENPSLEIIYQFRQLVLDFFLNTYTVDLLKK